MSITKIIGALIFLAGIALGAYVGIWVCIIGGIVQFVEAVKATPVDAWGIAFGVVRVWGAGLAAGVTFLFSSFIGALFFGWQRRGIRRKPIHGFTR